MLFLPAAVESEVRGQSGGLIFLPGQPSPGESQLVGTGVFPGGETPLGRIQNRSVHLLQSSGSMFLIIS